LEKLSHKDLNHEKSSAMQIEQTKADRASPKTKMAEEGEIVEEHAVEGKHGESDHSATEGEEEEGHSSSGGRGRGRPKGKGKGRAKGGRGAARGGGRGRKRKAPTASPTKPGEEDTAGRKRRKAVWETEIVENEANRKIVEEMNELSKRYYKEGDTGRGGKYAFASKVFRHTHHPIGEKEDTSKIPGIGSHIDKDVHEVQKKGESHRLEELEKET